ncbi:hypothetical protein [Solimonas flava]|uniref:hypothetical protein n=1 Tax=Solimonas flava TaxID=415849 RepID=UPI000406E910|nr:hypothetical protein [Solimonas flava]
MSGKASKLQIVTRELGAPAPDALAALDAASLQQLADALRDARRRQRAQMAAATDSALLHVPLLLRGAVRKILGIR